MGDVIRASAGSTESWAGCARSQFGPLPRDAVSLDRTAGGNGQVCPMGRRFLAPEVARRRVTIRTWASNTLNTIRECATPCAHEGAQAERLTSDRTSHGRRGAATRVLRRLGRPLRRRRPRRHRLTATQYGVGALGRGWGWWGQLIGGLGGGLGGIAGELRVRRHRRWARRASSTRHPGSSPLARHRRSACSAARSAVRQVRSSAVSARPSGAVSAPSSAAGARKTPGWAFSAPGSPGLLGLAGGLFGR